RWRAPLLASPGGADNAYTPLVQPPRPVETWFGSELRRLRLHAGLSQEALAERAGLSAASIAAYERGRRQRPYVNTLAALATALGLTPVERTAFMANGSAASQEPLEASRPTPRVRLPQPPTLLFGREMDIHQAAAQLNPQSSEVRLLCLVGP